MKETLALSLSENFVATLTTLTQVQIDWPRKRNVDHEL